jgi:hypothetical protein
MPQMMFSTPANVRKTAAKMALPSPLGVSTI